MTNPIPSTSNDIVQTDKESEVLHVDSLNVEYDTKEGKVYALRDISLTIKAGETLGIAGESGSGKSTLALAILQYLGDNGKIKSGDIYYKGNNLGELNKGEMRNIRGKKIAHVPQDPKTSLNPSLTVGEQIKETLLKHTNMGNDEAKAHALDILKQVNIGDMEYVYTQYPHELSGGMQQRILVAMALSCDPDLLILDEPTTGLDVTTQVKILDLINDLKEDLDTAIMLITHNLSVISQVCDSVVMLYAGEVMEQGSVTDIFSNPANPYTQGLLAALPQEKDDVKLKPIPGTMPDLSDIPAGCIYADRCEFADEQCRTGEIALTPVNDKTHFSRCRKIESVLSNPISPEQKEQSEIVKDNNEVILSAKDVKKYFGEGDFLSKVLSKSDEVKAVDGIDIDIKESETLGLVGESGSGKSTLGTVLLQLMELTDGEISYRGQKLADMDKQELMEFRSDCQMVFQNPHSSLNPSKTIRKILERPLKLHSTLNDKERNERVEDIIEEVGLGIEYLERKPSDLSGGEKQRVAISRAFIVEPSFIVLDEPLSALDVSVQASVLNLLKRLQEEYQTSFLFISHDLSVVKHISDRIAVMYLGKIVELGTKDQIIDPPYHPYTRSLLSNILPPDPNKEANYIHLEGDVPGASDVPSGCPFRTRCPQKIGEICETDEPGLEEIENGHHIACHLEKEEMSKPLEKDMS